MSRTVRLTFGAAALLITLSFATCDYAHHDYSSREEPPTYIISCGSYDPGVAAWESVGVLLGFVAFPVFIAGWLLWYGEVRIEAARTSLLRLDDLQGAEQSASVAPKDESVRRDKNPESAGDSIQPFDSGGLTPLERVIAG